MSEFDKNQSPESQDFGDPVANEAELFATLESLGADITFDENRLIGINAKLEKMTEQPITILGVSSLDDTRQAREKVMRRLAVNRAKFSHLMDVAGYLEKIQTEEDQGTS